MTVRSIKARPKLISEVQQAVRASQAAVAAVDHAVAERLGINATDHRGLDILDQQGPMTAGALADTLGLSRSAVTTVLDRLERRRYVRRLPSPDDRRRVLVALTPLFQRRARELYGDGIEAAAMLERYSVEQLALLLDFARSDQALNEDRARRLAGQARGRRMAARRQERAWGPTPTVAPKPGPPLSPRPER